MHRREVLATAAALVSWGALGVEGAVSGQGQPPTAPDPAFAAVTDDPALPRVLLIGDSISIGYTLPARRLLQGTANLHRIPVNGGPTSNGLEHLDGWIGGGQWDVIHFNWGLHDVKLLENGTHQVPIDAYAQNLRALVARLKRTGAALIWASTTPVPDATVSPPRRNSDVIAYNAVARRIMAESGIPINDLHAVAFPQLGEIQRPANVHYTAQGSEVLARHVAASIRAALDARR